MTVTVDPQKRVRLKYAKPGQRFDVQVSGDGKVILTKLEPVQSRPAKVTVSKRGRFSIGVLDRDIDAQALNEALAEFP